MINKYILIGCQLIVFFSLILAMPNLIFAGVKLKMSTLAQKGTAYSVTSIGFKRIVEHVAKNIGEDVKVVIYWSGVMGSDSQQVQKCQLGQIDGGYFWTGDAQRNIVPKSEILNFPFLINRGGGEGHYVRHRLRKDIIESAYKRNWVYMHFQNEGFGTLMCIGKSLIRKPEDLKEHRCATSMGLAETAFFEPHGIDTIPVSPQDGLQIVRSGGVTLAIGPIIFAVGLQAYTIWQEKGGGFIRPDFRFAICGVQITKRSLNKLSWPLKARLFYFPMPIMEYATYFVTYDAEASTEISLLERYNAEFYLLKGAELEAFKKPVRTAYLKYVGKEPERIAFYNNITKYKKEFASNKNKIDTYLVHKYNQSYALTNKNLREMKAALESYANTGSLARIKSLSDRHVIEKWRLYDRIKSAEAYANSGDSKALKEKFAVMMPDSFVDELFTKHMDEVKNAYGSKDAIKARIRECVNMIDDLLKLYPCSYQKKETKIKRTWL